MDATVLRDQFRGMGSKVVVEVVDGAAGHLALARDRLAFLEARWSRFRASSDLSRLNAAQGEPVVVDGSTIELLEAMVHGFTLTDGSFDPTLLAPLVRLGYASSIHDPAAVTELPVGVQRRGHIRGLVVDLNEMTVRLPPGTAVDAGGIGKGLAADMVAGLLMANGAGGAMVDIGGDVRVTNLGALPPIEDILPVRLKSPDEEEKQSAAVAIVIDRSGSMAGEKLEMAKSASIATACFAREVISTFDSLLSTMYASSSAVRCELMQV